MYVSPRHRSWVKLPATMGLTKGWADALRTRAGPSSTPHRWPPFLRLLAQLIERDELERVTADLTTEMGDDLEDLVNAKEGYALAEGDRKKRLRSLRSEQSHKEQRVRAMRLKLNSLATTRGEHQVCIWMTASVAPLLGLLCC